MRVFSKSKIMALRQCPKRLWLEIHHPELQTDSANTNAGFAVGNNVGEIARIIFDPQNRGAFIDREDNYQAAFVSTKQLMQSAIPIFEGGFSAGGGSAFTDVLLPDDEESVLAWHMIEVKGASKVKDEYLDDIAFQTFVAQSAGINLKSVSLAHVDTSWIYPGNNHYQGLLKINDLTAVSFGRSSEVKAWLVEAYYVAKQNSEPDIKTGSHCSIPYDCGFYKYCSRHKPKAEYPVEWLPRISAKKVEQLAAQGIYDLRDAPDEVLNDKQRLIKKVSITKQVYFYKFAMSSILSNLDFPLYFLDFETISFAVPIWKGTRPYQQIPFQFSLHKLTENGQLTHTEFLDLTGNNPSENFANTLISACDSEGEVIVYNAGFEMSRIKDLARMYPSLSTKLLSINERVEDMLPIAREYYYHPSQQGSWSIKKLLSAAVPELRYDVLDGVQDGNMAMAAFLEAINPDTAIERKEEIKQQLLAYCELDTYAMVRLWQVFSGVEKMNL